MYVIIVISMLWLDCTIEDTELQKYNRRSFQTPPACDLSNLISLIGSIYVESV